MSEESEEYRVVKDANSDVIWLAQCVLDNCAVIRRKSLINLFAGDDYNAFCYIESEARRLLEQYESKK